jgi:predicted RNase H-like nuclease (RuvC/YqgF family)
MTDDFEKISEYNQAGLQILRLHNAWTSCSLHRKHGNLLAYKWELEDIEMELSADISRLDEDKRNNFKFGEKIEELNFRILFHELKKNLLKYYSTLSTKEKLLRYIMEKSGKGSKLKHADEDDFD